jgi:hypothetical protein
MLRHNSVNIGAGHILKTGFHDLHQLQKEHARLFIRGAISMRLVIEIAPVNTCNKIEL